MNDTTEVTDQAATDQVAADEQAAVEAAFSAGFEGTEPPKASEPAKDETAKKDEPAVEAVTEPVAEPVRVLGMTEPELKAKLAEVDELKSTITKLNDTVHGRIGSVQQALKDLQKPAATTEVKVDSLSSLREAGYEELADLLAKDLSKLSVAQNQGTDPEAIKSMEAKFEARLTEVKDALEIKALTLAHKDWREIKGSEEFKAWRATLPIEAQAVLKTSRDAETLSEALTDFKTYKAAKKPAKDNKQTILESAITPSGTRVPHKPTASEQEEMEKGFSDGFNS